MANFSQIIDASLEWAATVCFRPFNPKKWLILTFTALMAGYLAGGFHLNSSGTFDREEKNGQAREISRDAGHAGSIDPAKKEELKPRGSFSVLDEVKKIRKPLITLIVLTVIIGLLLLVLMTWLCARFAFIFLENITRNDASIKLPFLRYKTIGNSYFKFLLAYMGTGFVIFAACLLKLLDSLARLGVFDKQVTVGFKQAALTTIHYAMVFIFLIIISGLVSLISNHFVVVAMFKDGIGFCAAWRKIAGILAKAKSDFIVYIFIIIGLAICSLICSGLLYLAALLGLFFPAGILFLLFYSISLLIPQSLHIFYYIALGIIFVPVTVFILYCLSSIYLPFAVFFRTLSIKFIASLEPHYNLFKYSGEEA